MSGSILDMEYMYHRIQIYQLGMKELGAPADKLCTEGSMYLRFHSHIPDQFE
jgi:hypothetical protein